MTLIKSKKSLKLRSEILEFDYSKNLQITVERIITDANGLVLTDGSIPDSLKISYPYFVLGSMDSQGKYKQARNSLPFDDVYFLDFFIKSDNSFLSWGYNSNIDDYISIGDGVFLYCDNDVTPNYYIWITVKCLPFAYGSVLGGSTGIYHCPFFYIEFLNNPSNINEGINVITLDDIANPYLNNLSPASFKSPNQETEIYRILANFDFTKFIGFTSKIQYNTTKIFFNFILNPIKNGSSSI